MMPMMTTMLFRRASGPGRVNSYTTVSSFIVEVRWMKIQHRLDSYRPSLIGCHSMFFVLVLILWVSQGDPSGAIGHSRSTCSCRSGLGFQNNELRPRRTGICPTCIFHSHSHGIPRRLPLAMQLQKKTNPHEFNYLEIDSLLILISH